MVYICIHVQVLTTQDSTNSNLKLKNEKKLQILRISKLINNLKYMNYYKNVSGKKMKMKMIWVTHKNSKN